jgi:transposase
MQHVRQFVGIDVSKADLDCTVHGSSSRVRVANEEVSICEWLDSLSSDTALAMESTGEYHQTLARLAHQRGFLVYVLNARDVYFYAKALGTRGKTDRSDAQVIARYLAEHHQQLHPWNEGTEAQERVRQLLRRRAGVTTHRAALRQLFRGVDGLQEQLEALEAGIAALLKCIDTKVQAELASDAQLHDASARLQTITGIGVQGSALLATLLGRIRFANADALIAYSGLDPRANDSGQKTGRRRLSKRGAPELRRQMYLAAFAASHSKALGPIYRSIKGKGFKPTQALVILARKLLRVAWAIWKSGKPFDPTMLNAKTACTKT